MTLLIVLQRAAASGEGLWPSSVSGWVALATGVGAFIWSVVLGIYAYGKTKARQEAAEERLTERLNGFGLRLERTEAFEDRMNGMDSERVRHLDRIDAEHQNLHREAGEAKASAEGCADKMVQHAIELGVLVRELEKRVGQFELAISQRVKGVETDIKHLSDGES